jgi:hypothetical protein
MTVKEIVRRVYFRPYRKGAGPVFTLILWDTGRYDRGKFVVGYRLIQASYRGDPGGVIFEGEDFATPNSIDGDDTVRGLMGFLTLQPGDTDKEYFDSYTPEQLSFAATHAEALSSEVYSRFGE